MKNKHQKRSNEANDTNSTNSYEIQPISRMSPDEFVEFVFKKADNILEQSAPSK